MNVFMYMCMNVYIRICEYIYIHKNNSEIENLPRHVVIQGIPYMDMSGCICIYVCMKECMNVCI
jgi:hypothetical protein